MLIGNQMQVWFPIFVPMTPFAHLDQRNGKRFSQTLAICHVMPPV
jgi:hypothetical protein